MTHAEVMEAISSRLGDGVTVHLNSGTDIHGELAGIVPEPCVILIVDDETIAVAVSYITGLS